LVFILLIIFRFANLKKLKIIFVFIFLAGMLFTVVNYIPTLNEETAQKKIELAKKNQGEESTDSDSEDETETDSENLFRNEGHIILSEPDTYSIAHYQYTLHYKGHLNDLSTPPPKI
jgi:hypothetical protein